MGVEGKTVKESTASEDGVHHLLLLPLPAFLNSALGSSRRRKPRFVRRKPRFKLEWIDRWFRRDVILLPPCEARSLQSEDGPQPTVPATWCWTPSLQSAKTVRNKFLLFASTHTHTKSYRGNGEEVMKRGFSSITFSERKRTALSGEGSAAADTPRPAMSVTPALTVVTGKSPAHTFSTKFIFCLNIRLRWVLCKQPFAQWFRDPGSFYIVVSSQVPQIPQHQPEDGGRQRAWKITGRFSWARVSHITPAYIPDLERSQRGPA